MPNAFAGLEATDGFSVDLGEVGEATQVSHRFVLRNVSEEPIRFREHATTSCGCTNATISRSLLLPGESTDVEVTVQIPPTSGEQRHYAVVLRRQMSDGVELDLPLTISAQTRPVWTAVPDFVLLRPRPGDNAAQQFTVNIFGSLGRQIRMVDAACSIPGSATTVDHGVLDHDRPTMVHVTWPGTAHDGEYQLRLQTDDPLVPSRSLTVRVKREEMLLVAPRSLLFRRSQHDSAFTGKLTVVVRDPEARIEVSQLPGLECVIRQDVAHGASFAKHAIDLRWLGSPDASPESPLTVSAVTGAGTIAVVEVPLRLAH